MSNASNRSRLASDMRFYAILSHIFPRRFSHKVALIACLGMQIPWVSLTMYLTPLSDRLALSLIDLAVIAGTFNFGSPADLHRDAGLNGPVISYSCCHSCIWVR